MKKLIKYIGILIVGLLVLSCFPNKDGKLYPEPSANPCFLSPEAQTLDIKIKNLADIEPYKSQWDDKITIEDGPPYTHRIQNDWINIFYERSNNKRSFINVSVKENLSSMSRSYNLRLSYTSNTTLFTITQKGKSK